MKINQPPVFQSLVSPGISGSEASAITSADAHFFASEIGQSSDADSHVSGGLLNHVSDMFKQLDVDSRHISSVLTKAAGTTDPMVLNKVGGELSKYDLENLMNAKIISKSVQGLDKLTNMQ
ncbi:hypothetical protein ED28_16230 [[Pantoea] beijingensis]|uniref:Uncharacterized protein n=1 Tax=[Pantoea] beijingensis TaxID=1324864 RepID=A0A443IAR2_9GAMM|nr:MULTISPECIES: EscI/YscI/HrpB family type III secretion system inner rod protein [Erwiniaceae]RWR00996.1 hypothetical protein ED28_16230 [[Pantoea] beijingensis]